MNTFIQNIQNNISNRKANLQFVRFRPTPTAKAHLIFRAKISIRRKYVRNQIVLKHDSNTIQVVLCIYPI